LSFMSRFRFCMAGASSYAFESPRNSTRAKARLDGGRTDK